jgi:hypothetical protein
MQFCGGVRTNERTGSTFVLTPPRISRKKHTRSRALYFTHKDWTVPFNNTSFEKNNTNMIENKTDLADNNEVAEPMVSKLKSEI